MAKKGASAAKFVTEMNARAERLSAVRTKIRIREEAWKLETEALFAEEKTLKESLLADLNTLGISSVKDKKTGDSYFISRAHDFKFTNPIEEDRWARENRCIRVDRVALKQNLKLAYNNGTLPASVEVTDRETISVRKAKEGEAATQGVG